MAIASGARIMGRWKGQGGLIGPLLALIVIAVLGSAIVIGSLVRQADYNAAAGLNGLVRGAYASERNNLAMISFQTAHWDDAVSHLYGGIDQDWASTNLSYPMHTYITDGRGRQLWGMGAGGSKFTLPLASAMPTVTHMIRHHLPQRQHDAEALTIGVAQAGLYQGRPAIVAAMPILPLLRSTRLPDNGLRYIVFIRELDDRVLSNWRREFNLRGLTWLPADAGTAENRLKIRDPHGRPIGTLDWTAATAGADALRDIRSKLILVIVGVALCCALLIRQIIRSGGQLRASMTAARRSAAESRGHAEDADTARQEAERCAANAEDARQRADAMALREIEAQTRHREQLEAAQRDVAAALRESLSALVEELLQSAGALERSADRTLSTVAQQQSRALAVRHRSQEATLAVRAITDTLEQLSVSIEEIATVTEDAHVAARDAADRSERTQKIGGTLLGNVKMVESSANLIADISRQTNLLALNARIEAARAGAAGAGFAVVANEVKALAQQAHLSTKQIQDCIDGIATTADETVESVGIVDTLMAGLLAAVTSSAAAVHQQHESVAEIRQNATGVAENARVADEAVSAISISLGSIAETAGSTREIGLTVRAHAEQLRARFTGLLAQLEAA